jgi:hypothetical protein
MHTLRLLVACAAMALPNPAAAVDEPTDSMAGKVMIIKAGKLAKFVAKPPITGGTFALPGSGNDPVTQGGQLRLVDLGDPNAADVVFGLPAAGWKGLGNPPGAKGYKYKGAGSAADPCKVVLVKEKIVKAVCKGAAVDLAQPLNGTLGIVLTVGSDSKHYCTEFGGSTLKNDATFTKRKSATAPACACGAVPPKQVHLINTVGTGDCGTVTTTSGASSGLECGGLYLGSGSAALSLPAVTPDSVEPVIFDVDCCTGDTLLLGPSNDADTGGQNLSCTKAGCFFGAPLPIPNTLSPPTSTCVVNTYQRDARGELDCSTGATRLDLPLVSATFLTGDILPRRCSGGTSPGLRCTTLGADPACTGGTCVNDPDIQPCPVCNPTTLVCNGGFNNGMACVPDGGGGTGLSQYPTSHDCPISTLVLVGNLPVPFLLTTGTSTKTAAPSGTKQRVFCGFCRDADGTGGFGICTAGTNLGSPCSINTPDCGTGGVCGDAKPCETGADCAADSASRESCEQRNDGAFGPGGGASLTITEIGTPSGNVEDYAAHPGTAVSVFCIPPSFNPIIDPNADLPGPGAVSLPSTIQLVSPSGAFIDRSTPY